MIFAHPDQIIFFSSQIFITERDLAIRDTFPKTKMVSVGWLIRSVGREVAGKVKFVSSRSWDGRIKLDRRFARRGAVSVQVPALTLSCAPHTKRRSISESERAGFGKKMEHSCVNLNVIHAGAT